MDLPPFISSIEAARLIRRSRERVLKLLRDCRIAGRKSGGGNQAPWIVDRDSALAFRPGKRGPARKSKPRENATEANL